MAKLLAYPVRSEHLIIESDTMEASLVSASAVARLMTADPGYRKRYSDFIAEFEVGEKRIQSGKYRGIWSFHANGYSSKYYIMVALGTIKFKLYFMNIDRSGYREISTFRPYVYSVRPDGGSGGGAYRADVCIKDFTTLGIEGITVARDLLFSLIAMFIYKGVIYIYFDILEYTNECRDRRLLKRVELKVLTDSLRDIEMRYL